MVLEELRNVLAAVFREAGPGREGAGPGREGAGPGREGGGPCLAGGGPWQGGFGGAGAEPPKALNQRLGRDSGSRSFGSTLQAFLSPRSPEGKAL